MSNTPNRTLLVCNGDQAINSFLLSIINDTDFHLHFYDKANNLLPTIESLKPEIILLNIANHGLKNGEFENLKNVPDIPVILWGVKSKSDTTIFDRFKLLDCFCDIEDPQEVVLRLKNLVSLKESIADAESTNARIEKLQRDKNELIGIAAHDLKNPIYSISMLAKVLRDDLSLTRDDIKEFSNDIIVTSERMLELIKHLLDLNAIEEGKFKIHLEVFNLYELLSASLDVYREIASHKKIKIFFDTKSDTQMILADRGATLQVFDNLLSNAIKFSPFEKSIYISIDGVDSKLRLSIKDEGPGLTDDDKKKLFQKFARLSAQPTHGENSTGLGLSIVKKVVEAMNGDIIVESQPGQGATFIVEFPKA